MIAELTEQLSVKCHRWARVRRVTTHGSCRLRPAPSTNILLYNSTECHDLSQSAISLLLLAQHGLPSAMLSCRVLLDVQGVRARPLIRWIQSNLMHLIR